MPTSAYWEKIPENFSREGLKLDIIFEGGFMGSDFNLQLWKTLLSELQDSKIVSPGQLSDFYRLQNENGPHFPVYGFLICSVTVYVRKYSLPPSTGTPVASAMPI